jgi:hypothetical protein
MGQKFYGTLAELKRHVAVGWEGNLVYKLRLTYQEQKHVDVKTSRQSRLDADGQDILDAPLLVKPITCLECRQRTLQRASRRCQSAGS